MAKIKFAYRVVGKWLVEKVAILDASEKHILIQHASGLTEWIVKGDNLYASAHEADEVLRETESFRSHF